MASGEKKSARCMAWRQPNSAPRASQSRSRSTSGGRSVVGSVDRRRPRGTAPTGCSPHRTGRGPPPRRASARRSRDGRARAPRRAPRGRRSRPGGDGPRGAASTPFWMPTRLPLHQVESVDAERQHVVRRLQQADRAGGEIDPEDAPRIVRHVQRALLGVEREPLRGEEQGGGRELLDRIGPRADAVDRRPPAVGRVDIAVPRDGDVAERVRLRRRPGAGNAR